MNLIDYRGVLQSRMDRWRLFHASNEPGDLLVIIDGDRGVSLESVLCSWLSHLQPDDDYSEQSVKNVIAEYVSAFRNHGRQQSLAYDDDMIATALVYWGIGSITAAMTGGTPYHDGYTSWYEPDLSWDQINELQFQQQNRWLQLALHINQQLWNHWEEDFHILPYLHRSPLDAANGLRGTDLFADMISAPDKVHRLLEWCVDWQLRVETMLRTQVNRPACSNWGTAVWGAWLPDGAVFVNGDPVGLISRKMAIEYDRPYTGKLFTNTGGGFFHNHTVGLYQADVVANYPGLMLQWFVNDPKQPSLEDALLYDPPMRERLLEASCITPIGGFGFSLAHLDEVIDIVRHGRFVLTLSSANATSEEMSQAIRKVRAVSNLH